MTQAPARSVLPAPSVLVVEDDDNIAAVLEYILLREGLTHQRVATGATALAVMQANSLGGNAKAMAKKLAIQHLAIAAESSLLLPHQCGQLLHQLALDLTDRISLAAP